MTDAEIGHYAEAYGDAAHLRAAFEVYRALPDNVLICCCDGLCGLPAAITATWPRATVQTCCVHLMRANPRFASKNVPPRLESCQPMWWRPTWWRGKAISDSK